MNTWRTAWRVAHMRPVLFWVAFAFWVGFYTVPLLTGLIAREIFNALSEGAPGANLATLIATLVAAEAGHIVVFLNAAWWWHVWWLWCNAALRMNILGWLVDGPGARRLPDSPGEAVSRFREDVQEFLEFIDTWLDMAGQVLFALVALAIMATINPLITAVIAAPLVLVIVITEKLVVHLRRYRRQHREATGRITSFIGEMFGAVQAVKMASAEERVTARFRVLGEVRRRAAVKDRLFMELLESVNLNTANLAVGVILLLAAGSMRSGEFTVGDFALFTSYLLSVTQAPQWIGRLLARHRHAGVSLERMDALLAGAPRGTLVTARPLPFKAAAPALQPPVACAEPLRELAVRGLTYRFPDSGGGVEGIDLMLKRGSFTVITGRVGSGKTTLLRALLGLVPADSGSVRWNSADVADPGSFFVPPRAAYTPQAPRLFSERLSDNILLGAGDQTALDEAIRLAVLEPDIAAMEQGLETVVGPRGVRLSGGQAQRTAAARMFVRRPQLLVFDDLSSALDVETERILWERLAARPELTCLVVSHRRAALRRADEVIVLAGGRVAGRGRLDHLLETNSEMRRLWQADTEERPAIEPEEVGVTPR